LFNIEKNQQVLALILDEQSLVLIRKISKKVFLDTLPLYTLGLTVSFD
jgi:hypothetical protein